MIAEELLQGALAEAQRLGADYAEARAADQRGETINGRDSAVERLTRDADGGWGLRVAVNGGWGFAATAETTPDAVAATAARAVEIARASAARRVQPLLLDDMPRARGSYATPMGRDPFAVPVEERIDLLLRALGAARATHARVKVAEGHIRLWHTDKLFVNTTGARLHQQSTACEGEIRVYAQDDGGYSYGRSYGNMAQAGWEYIEALRLVEEAPRVAQEAADLVVAEWAPAGPRTVVVGPGMMALLIHESCGHPIELDRVLGWEAAFAGTSFLMPDMRGQFRYGS
ncbi:MAG TPA: DNA gyrase modulator, partial [Chloroflexia bacterium]|nr:DNA gyrase modulator [Chloroflexia bacterium]